MTDGKHEPSAEFRALFRANVEMPDLGDEVAEYYAGKPDDMVIFDFAQQMFTAELRHAMGTGRPVNFDAVCVSTALGLRELGFHRGQ